MESVLVCIFGLVCICLGSLFATDAYCALRSIERSSTCSRVAFSGRGNLQNLLVMVRSINNSLPTMSSIVDSPMTIFS